VKSLAQRLALSVRGELAVAGLVLVAAAILTGLAPAREELARRDSGLTVGPVDRTVDATGLAAHIRISPATVGQNHFEVDLPGTDPAIVERVQLTTTFLDQELGSQPLVLQPADGKPGTWQGDAAVLSQAGQWQVELFVRRTAMDDARTAFRFTVVGPGGAPASSAPVAAYPLLPSPMVSLAYGLIALGIIVLAYAILRPGRVPRQGRAAAAAAGLVVALCGGYVYAQEQRGGTTLDVANVRNPVPPDQRSLAAGEATYQQHCAVCHGDTGRGDGPGGLRLVPRPADLRVHMAAGHTDGQLFYWVSYGVTGTAMPAWSDTLSGQDRWDVINYIRTFADPNPTAPGSGS
jgi:mono/diheme cytochrome c family protein